MFAVLLKYVPYCKLLSTLGRNHPEILGQSWRKCLHEYWECPMQCHIAMTHLPCFSMKHRLKMSKILRFRGLTGADIGGFHQVINLFINYIDDFHHNTS